MKYRGQHQIANHFQLPLKEATFSRPYFELPASSPWLIWEGHAAISHPTKTGRRNNPNLSKSFILTVRPAKANAVGHWMNNGNPRSE